MSNNNKSHNRHEPHSKTLPTMDLSFVTPYALATAKPFSLTNLNNFSNITPPSNDLNYSLDVNEHVSDASTDYSQYSQSDTNHFQSYYQQSPNERSSPSSLLLHQLTLPNLPHLSLNLNDSKTTEEDVLCALDPSPIAMVNDDVIRIATATPKLKLLREAAKSEPPYPASYHQAPPTRNHTKSSKSLHIKHITSQPPPMPTYYIHSSYRQKQNAPITMHKKVNVQTQQQQHKKHHNRVHFDKSVTPKPKLSANNMDLIPSKSAPGHTHSKTNCMQKHGGKTRANGKKMKRSETPQPVYTKNRNQKDSGSQVRVMRDKEVLQIDQEIPIEKFISALKKGYARIMTQDQQNEEYNKSARIARSVSVGNMQAYKDEILAAAQQEKHRKLNHRKLKKNQNVKGNKPFRPKSKSEHKKNKSEHSKNKFELNVHLSKSIPPKLLQCVENNSSDSDESMSGSSSLDLLDPPKQIETARDMVVKACKPKLPKMKIKIKRSTTGNRHKKNARIRSKTATNNSSKSKSSKANGKFPFSRTRSRPNGHYRTKAKAKAHSLVTQPSLSCPRSPSIPEEDDILDIDHMLAVHGSGDDAMSSHSDNSSYGFSSDSDSSSTDHDCEMPNPLKPSSKVLFSATSTPPAESPSLERSSKSCDALLSGLKKFKIIKQSCTPSKSFESTTTDSHEFEESTESIIRDMADDVDEKDDFSDVDSDGIGSIGSGNHLTTSMYTKIEHNAITPLQLAIVDEMRQRSLSNEHNVRDRTLSNGSIASNASSASSSSSCSSSSDWDEEVREEEEEERHKKLQGNGSASESIESELATSSDSESDVDDEDCDDALLLSLQQSNKNQDSNDNIPIRPQSTPFRSSKGTAAFLSHLKSYGSGKLSGNLNELINGVSRKLNKTERQRKNKNMSQQNDSQMKPIKTIKPVMIIDKYKTKFADNPNGYNSPQPLKMKKNKKKKFKASQKRKNVFSSKVNV